VSLPQVISSSAVACSPPENDKQLHVLAPLRVGNADGARLLDLRMLVVDLIISRG
jgi:hypothetical protein